MSLKTIFPDVEFDLRSYNPRANTLKSAPLDPAQARPTSRQPKPVPPGSYTGAAIILLTDGQTTTGPDPIESARMAADRGVRVYTVGIGTAGGEIIGAEGWSMRVRLDEESLKTIANLTRGEYFYAGNAADLQKIYQNLNTRIFLEQKETEITALFAAAAALLRVPVGAAVDAVVQPDHVALWDLAAERPSPLFQHVFPLRQVGAQLVEVLVERVARRHHAERPARPRRPAGGGSALCA